MARDRVGAGWLRGLSVSPRQELHLILEEQEPQITLQSWSTLKQRELYPEVFSEYWPKFLCGHQDS